MTKYNRAFWDVKPDDLIMKKNLTFRSTAHLSFLVLSLILTSCSSASKKHHGASAIPTKDGFASEGVREAYLRLKKKDYTEEDKKIDEQESSKIAKEQSKSTLQ